MREHTAANLPFAMSFYSYSEKNQSSKGVVTVKQALLRPGFSASKGIKSESLIAYYDLEKKREGFFYLPLLLSYKEHQLWSR